MNRFVKSGLLFCALALGLSGVWSCQEDPKMEVNPTSISFTQAGGSESVSITSNVDWTASVTGNGLSVQPTSGKGNAQVTVTAAPASAVDPIQGSLIIKSETLQATVTISQEAKSTLVASAENVVDAMGGQYTIVLQYNTEYTVEVDANATSWIQQIGTRSLSTTNLQFEIAPNNGTERTGTITIKDAKGIAPNVVITVTQKENAQRAALMALYRALDGDNWKEDKRTNWGTDASIDTWQGVTVDEATGMVTKLALNGAGATGSIPAAIGDLTALTSLNMGTNDLTGPLPAEMGNLVNLESLLLVKTKLSGNLPKEMGNLSKLTNLQLNDNQITGTIPAEWAGMVSLQNVGLYSTQLSTPIPEALLTAWTHIGTLLLYNNPNFTGTLPDFGKMTTDAALFNIQIYDCNFTGGIPDSWGSLPEVSKQLYIYGNQLTEPVPLSLQAHPSWSEDRWDQYKKNTDIHYVRTQQNNVFLDLAVAPNNQRETLMAIYNALDGKNWKEDKQTNWGTQEDISTWAGVKMANGAVIELNLSQAGLNGQLPGAIGNLTQLTKLTLSTNPNLTGSLPKELGNLENLTAFVCVGTGLSGNLPKEMGNLNKLTNLQLNNNNLSGTIPKEWAGMVSLQNVGLYGTQLSTPLPEELLTGWKHINSLMLHSNPNFTGPLPDFGKMTTDAALFNIQMYDCNFTGTVPASWGQIPTVSKQLYIYGNRLEGQLPYEVVSHPSWTEDRWNQYKKNTDIHYVRTQQNGVFLGIAAVAPTMSAISIEEVTTQGATLTAQILHNGGSDVKEAGLEINGYQYKASAIASDGTFTVILDALRAGATYEVKAYAKNEAGTGYSQPATFTTLEESYIMGTVTTADGSPVEGAMVYFKRVGAWEPSVAAQAARPATRSHAKTPSLYLPAGATEKDAAKALVAYVRQWAAPLANVPTPRPGTRSTAARVNTRGDITEYDYKEETATGGNLHMYHMEPGVYSLCIKGNNIVDFYAQVALQPGSNNLQLTNVPTGNAAAYVHPFNSHLDTKAFVASEQEMAIATSIMSATSLQPYTGKNIENIVFYPADTLSGMILLAKNEGMIQEINNAFESFSQIDMQNPTTEDLTNVIQFMNNYGPYVLPVGGVTGGQTNVVYQPKGNMNALLWAGVDESQAGIFQLLGLSTKSTIALSSGDQLAIAFIALQAGDKGLLMTDGDGPAVENGNLLMMASHPEVNQLSQLGYPGNWHLGVTFK